MKPSLILLFFTVLFGACSQNEPVVGPTGIVRAGFELDSVSTLEASKSVDVVAYYTQLDTTIENKTIPFVVRTYVPEKDTAIFKWSVGGSIPFQVENRGIWEAGDKTWLMSSQATISPGTFTGTIPVKVEILLKSTSRVKSRSTNLTIRHDKKEFDLLRVNFGMTKEEVKVNQSFTAQNSNSGWSEPLPSIILSPNTKHYIGVNSLTAFEFLDNKLIMVSEMESNGTSSGFERFSEIARRFGFNGGPITKLPVSWTKGKIKFTIQDREVQTSATEKKTYRCIIYERP